MPKLISKPKETILKIAKYHLMDQGIETLNMRAIAKDAEISVGTLYNYFPNKDFIVIALIADFWEDFLDELEAIGEGTADCWQAFREMYRQLEKTLKVFRLDWLSGTGFQSDEARLEGRRLQTDYRKRVIVAIEKQLKKHASVTDAFTTDELAQFILSNWLGMQSFYSMDYDLFERMLKKLIRKEGEIHGDF